jgi:hypothetical protein
LFEGVRDVRKGKKVVLSKGCWQATHALQNKQQSGTFGMATASYGENKPSIKSQVCHGSARLFPSD